MWQKSLRNTGLISCTYRHWSKLHYFRQIYTTMKTYQWTTWNTILDVCSYRGAEHEIGGTDFKREGRAPLAPPLATALQSILCLLIYRFIQISPSCWTIYRSFEIILEVGTVHWIGLQIQCFVQIHCFKKHLVRYELCFKKYLFASGSSGSNGWARVKRERKKSRECLLRTILIYSGHPQHECERLDMKRKYMNNEKAQRR